jgi:hypothetical protein
MATWKAIAYSQPNTQAFVKTCLKNKSTDHNAVAEDELTKHACGYTRAFWLHMVERPDLSSSQLDSSIGVVAGHLGSTPPRSVTADVTVQFLRRLTWTYCTAALRPACTAQSEHAGFDP